MRVLSSMQAGVLHKPFSFNGRHFSCLALLWPFRLESGEAVLESEMWQALGDYFMEGRVFDHCMPKDRAEFLCLGTFYAPGGKPVPQEAASVRVGDTVKKILVSGPRYWRGGRATRPESITTLPIRYDQAFGGENYPDNPIGKGYDQGGSDAAPSLPCLEYPSEAVASRSDTPKPASLEPRDIAWKPRQRFAGTYDEAYMRTRMPGLPDDVDWRLFNDAAEDQWIEGFFGGAEEFELLNLHPDQQRLRGALPGVLGRAFVECKLDPASKDSALEFREVPLRLDTVWLLPDAGLGIVVHRGTFEIREDDGTDVVNILAAHEKLTETRRPVEHYREEMRKRSDPENGYRYMLDTSPLLPSGTPCALQDLMTDNDMEMEHLSQGATQRYLENQQEKASARIDGHLDDLQHQTEGNEGQLPADAANIDKVSDQAKAAVRGERAPQSDDETEFSRIIEKIAPRTSTGAVDLTKVDFNAFDELDEFTERLRNRETEKSEKEIQSQIVDLKRQNDPETEEMSRAIRQLEDALTSRLEPAPLPRPKIDLDIAELEKQISALEQFHDEMRQGGLSQEQIRGALPDLGQLQQQLAAAEQQATEGYREVAHYEPQSRSPHPGEEPRKRKRLLEIVPGSAEAATGDYAFVDLSGQTLRGIDLSYSYLEYVDFTDATLVDVNLTGAILAKARLENCRFENVSFFDANLGATLVVGATFDNCDLRQVRLGLARIEKSRFNNCNLTGRMEMFLDAELRETAFVKCALQEMNLIERNLDRIAFDGSDLSSANFIKCRFVDASFTGARLSSTNFVSTTAPQCSFDDAVMDNVRFIDEPVLNDCSFRRANLQGANLRECDLAGADFTDAVLEGADFSSGCLNNAVLTRARAIGAQFHKADIGGASLMRADLREASLMKARMLQTRLTGANLYSVSFLQSTLGNTDFTGANLDNTILREWRPFRG